MLSLFKAKSTPPAPPTLKTRVQQFWKWYAEVAPRFYQTIEDKQCPSLAPEVSAKVDEFLPGFSWVFGPGENHQGHSFTLTAEGNAHRQLITLYWLSLAPTLPGWTFYASRQPDSIKGKRIDIGEKTFNPEEFWLTPSINAESERIDITVWHPLFAVLPERDRWTILFLFLDEILGEYGTQQSIGKITMDSTRLAEAMPLEELLPFVKKTEAEAGWKKYPPGEAGTIYRMPEPHDRFLRGDIKIGSTTHIALINDYANAKGEFSDPLKGTGADYVFVKFDATLLPKGRESHARGEIEEALTEALKPTDSGRVLGGAFGSRYGYIDLLLYDGQNSLKLVESALRLKPLPAGTEIHFFAKEKRGHRIVL